jgi:hypothetical protein
VGDLFTPEAPKFIQKRTKMLPETNPKNNPKPSRQLEVKIHAMDMQPLPSAFTTSSCVAVHLRRSSASKLKSRRTATRKREPDLRLRVCVPQQRGVSPILDTDRDRKFCHFTSSETFIRLSDLHIDCAHSIRSGKYTQLICSRYPLLSQRFDASPCTCAGPAHQNRTQQ